MSSSHSQRAANLSMPVVGPECIARHHTHITSYPSMSSPLLLRTANFSIPVAGPEFKEVTFVEDSGAIAAQVVKQQRAAGRAWLDWHKLESVRRQSVNQGQEQERATQVRSG